MANKPDRKSQALGVLYLPTDQLALSTFLAMSQIIGLVGHKTAGVLLSHTAYFHEREIVPFLEAGKRFDVHLNGKMLAKWMRNRRDHPSVERERFRTDRQDGSFLYSVACCEFCWRIETLLWEGGVVCLSGLGTRDRDAVYLALLKVLEVRWKVGMRTEKSLMGYLDGVLNEKWAWGMLPDEDTAREHGRKMMVRRPQGKGVGAAAACAEGCRCRERKEEVYLEGMDCESDRGFYGEPQRRKVVLVASTLPEDDLDDLDDIASDEGDLE